MEYGVWSMEYGVIHIGKRNLKFQYQMNDGWVKSVGEERDNV